MWLIVHKKTGNKKYVFHINAEFEEIIPMFLKNRQKDVGLMIESLIKQDFDAIRVIGHNMKGCGRGYGFDNITDIGRAIQFAAESKDAEEIRKQIQELKDFLENVEILYTKL